MRRAHGHGTGKTVADHLGELGLSQPVRFNLADERQGDHAVGPDVGVSAQILIFPDFDVEHIQGADHIRLGGRRIGRGRNVGLTVGFPRIRVGHNGRARRSGFLLRTRGGFGILVSWRRCGLGSKGRSDGGRRQIRYRYGAPCGRGRWRGRNGIYDRRRLLVGVSGLARATRYRVQEGADGPERLLHGSSYDRSRVKPGKEYTSVNRGTQDCQRVTFFSQRRIPRPIRSRSWSATAKPSGTE